jgi:hypothetical protein
MIPQQEGSEDVVELARATSGSEGSPTLTPRRLRAGEVRESRDQAALRPAPKLHQLRCLCNSAGQSASLREIRPNTYGGSVSAVTNCTSVTSWDRMSTRESSKNIVSRPTPTSPGGLDLGRPGDSPGVVDLATTFADQTRLGQPPHHPVESPSISGLPPSMLTSSGPTTRRMGPWPLRPALRSRRVDADHCPSHKCWAYLGQEVGRDLESPAAGR